jgi:hypothetical protein
LVLRQIDADVVDEHRAVFCVVRVVRPTLGDERRVRHPTSAYSVPARDSA